jgi:pimeloyl-ACP methyl ester carboxylesterase
MPTAAVGGRELHYEVAGAGPAVVLVHSTIADSSLWDPLVEALRGRFRVLRYDVAGFGRSPLPPGRHSHLRDLEALLEQTGIERAALVGSSFGGRISLEFTLEHPEVVTALALVAPGLPDHEWGEAKREADRLEEELFDAGDFEGAADTQVRLWVDGPGRGPDAVDPALRERARRMILRSYELYSEAARDGEPGPVEWTERPASARLDEIAVPTLVVVGEDDVRDMHEIAARLTAGIGGARSVVVPDAAHLLPLERPAELNQILLEFLTAA